MLISALSLSRGHTSAKGMELHCYLNLIQMYCKRFLLPYPARLVSFIKIGLAVVEK